MRMYDLIYKKKYGGKLSKEEIDFIVQGYTKGDIPDYQMSAFLMAVCLKGMDMEETTNLTLSMRDSGETLDLSKIHGIKVDKHSTGGVGDKTSLCLSAMVAACGVPVAKMSGRGLGHTGGTIDKLESIKGFSTSISGEQFFENVIMPQSFADALGTADKESVLAKRDDGTVDFAQDVFWELRGIDPTCYGDNPAGYTLPENKDDPCVQDWDEDGNPGLSISAKGAMGGNMYMIEKASSKIHDGLVSADGQKITALVDWTDKQKILWASTDTLEKGSDNVQQNSSSQAGFGNGPFNFIEQFKIPEGSDCAYIVTNAATLFSPDPVTLK